MLISHCVKVSFSLEDQAGSAGVLQKKKVKKYVG